MTYFYERIVECPIDIICIGDKELLEWNYLFSLMPLPLFKFETDEFLVRKLCGALFLASVRLIIDLGAYLFISNIDLLV